MRKIREFIKKLQALNDYERARAMLDLYFIACLWALIMIFIALSEVRAETVDDYSEYEYSEAEAVAVATTIFAEANGLSETEQSLVAWTILNRVDYDGFGSDVLSVVSAPGQFAYWAGGRYTDTQYDLAVDVLQRYAAEKDGVKDVGRTLPPEYLYFYGNGAHNYFRSQGGNENRYDFSSEYPSPY